MYFESGIYGVIGAVIGSVLSLPLMQAVNNLYSFRYSPMRFGVDDALIGLISSVGFVALCTTAHIAKQKRKSASERLNSTNLDTDSLLKRKNLIFAIPLVLLIALTVLLPVRHRYVGAFLLLFATVVFIYVISRYIIGLFASLISSLLAKRNKGAGDFILAAKSCESSYPLRHAGRIITVLLTVFITLGAILSAASGEITAFVDITSADYVGVMVDGVTKEKISKVEGVVAVAEASMKADVVFEGGKASTGISVSGDISECFDLDAMPKDMPYGNFAAVSHGISRMLGVAVGDVVKCEIGGVPCELVVTEIVDTHGDFIYYDATFIGSGYDMLCITTDGSDATYERMSAIFDERGVECLTKDEYFSFAKNRINPQLTIFKAMFYAMIALTFIAVVNVLAEQRIARAREFEIMVQNGKTARGVICLEATEILYLVIFSLVIATVFSHLLYFIVDRAVISFGMTLYV